MSCMKKCSDCRKFLNEEKFIQNDKILATCQICREKKKLSRFPKRDCSICGIRGNFGFENNEGTVRCKKHKEIGMIDIKHKKCIICKIVQPNYAFPNQTSPTHCKGCAEDNMIDIKHKKCIICKITRPNFNFPNEIIATHCKGCSMVGMENIKDKKCIICKKTCPTYGFPNNTIATHCKKCSTKGMENIKRKKCIICKKICPSYAFLGETTATHCKGCSESDMIDIVHKKCVICKKKIPAFALLGKKATHCQECSTANMENVVSKKCIICKKKQPNYNFPNKTTPTHCKECLEIGMIDIRHKKCIVCKKIRPSYGFVGQSITHCVTHMLPRMYKNPTKKCLFDDCKEIATFGKQEPLHCDEHSKEDEICLVGKKCINCGRENELLNREGLCITYCKPTKIYDVIKQEKKKEKLVLNYLDKYINFPSIDDKQISVRDKPCFDIKSRPDRIYDCNTHYLIIEIDEHQHSHLNKICEESRMHQIQEALGFPAIFIRFNPDNFRVVGVLQKVNMQKRLEFLVKWIEKLIEPRYEECLSLLYKKLYYDEFNELDISLNLIDDIKLSREISV